MKKKTKKKTIDVNVRIKQKTKTKNYIIFLHNPIEKRYKLIDK